MTRQSIALALIVIVVAEQAQARVNATPMRTPCGSVGQDPRDADELAAENAGPFPRKFEKPVAVRLPLPKCLDGARS